jgi:putative Ca2+/H+ antiporter (TMEM165/GDT1 family)
MEPHKRILSLMIPFGDPLSKNFRGKLPFLSVVSWILIAAGHIIGDRTFFVFAAIAFTYYLLEVSKEAREWQRINNCGGDLGAPIDTFIPIVTISGFAGKYFTIIVEGILFVLFIVVLLYERECIKSKNFIKGLSQE